MKDDAKRGPEAIRLQTAPVIGPVSGNQSCRAGYEKAYKAGAASQRGSGWCRCKGRPAVVRNWDAHRKWDSATSDGF